MKYISKYLLATEIGYSHFCPACDTLHQFNTTRPLANGAQWTFNNNFDLPTFNPAMRIFEDWEDHKIVCHYFLHMGQLIYQSDCTHDYKGQTIKLPELPDRYVPNAYKLRNPLH